MLGFLIGGNRLLAEKPRALDYAFSMIDVKLCVVIAVPILSLNKEIFYSRKLSSRFYLLGHI